MDVLIALAVLALLAGTIIGVVWWARGGAPYDDGTGEAYVPYVPEPDRRGELPTANDQPEGTPR